MPWENRTAFTSSDKAKGLIIIIFHFYLDDLIFLTLPCTVYLQVLIGAFIRGTRDPFPPSRTASVQALAATQQYFLLQEVANRILPALCPLTTDPDKGVRDNAFRTIRGFLSKLERVSEDPGLRESMGQY